MNSFQDLQLPPSLEKALAALEFTKPTPIQEKAIPVALEGRCLVGCAQTGTGKTAAFCIPLIVQLLKDPEKTALILVPTRELVLQIETFWRQLTRFLPALNAASLMGGMPMQRQYRDLARKPRLVIATPGRLLDHLTRKSVKLTQASFLVLDEADRMLDMGFAPQLNRILAFLPPSEQRQTLLFTATWGPEMDQLGRKYLVNPVRVSVGETSRAASTVTQSLVSTSVKDKNEVLLDHLNQRQGSVLIFARTKSRTDRVATYLASYGIAVNRIHGDRSQGQRTMALSQFRNGQVRVLVATDLAARGIDVSEIAHVINYDLPQAPEDYVHRIGRTGRAGCTGEALSLITPEDREQWNRIARLLKRSGSAVPTAIPATPVTPRDRNRPQPTSPAFPTTMASRREMGSSSRQQPAREFLGFPSSSNNKDAFSSPRPPRRRSPRFSDQQPSSSGRRYGGGKDGGNGRSPSGKGEFRSHGGGGRSSGGNSRGGRNSNGNSSFGSSSRSSSFYGDR